MKGKGLAGSFKLGKGKAVAGAEKKADKAGGKAKKGPKKVRPIKKVTGLPTHKFCGVTTGGLLSTGLPLLTQRL